MKTKSFLLVTLILTLLAACQPANPQMIITPSANAITTPLSSEHLLPSGVTLEANGQAQEAGLGSHCWFSKGVKTCADMGWSPAARDPLVWTEFPVNAQFHFETELAPENVTMSIMPATTELVGADGVHRFWNPGQGWSGSLSPKVSIEYPFQEKEFANGNGLYVIQISASWKDWGDASYGFLIQIGAGNQQIDITPERVWWLRAMAPVTRLGKGAASSLALSADGKWLALNTPLGVYGYETKTQTEIWLLPMSDYWRGLDFSPDGKRLAIGAQNGGVLVVRSDSGEKLYHIATEDYGQPDWSPDGTKLLTGASCGEVRVWDANTGALLHTLQEVKCSEGTYVVQAVWSGDGKRIYKSDNNGYVLAWDATTYQPLIDYQPNPPQYSYGLEIVPSPTQNLFALLNGLDIAVMDGRTGEIVKTLAGNYQDRGLEEIAWSPDGKFLAAGNFGEITIWDVNTGQQIYNSSEYQPLPGFNWMPDSETLVGLLSPDGSLNAVKLDGEIVFSFYEFGMMNGYSSTVSWEGDQLVTNDGAHITHWGALTGKMLKEEQATSQPIWTSSQLSPDGTRIASPDVVMDSKNLKEITHLIDNPEHERDQVAWSPDSATLASGDSLNIAPIIIWDAQTGKQIFTLPTSDISLHLGTLAFSPDGSLLAAGGSLIDPANGLDNGVLILWNTYTGERVYVLKAGMSSDQIISIAWSLVSIAWSPDGHWLAAGTNSGPIILWDMLTLKPVASLEGHADDVLGLSWSDDSTLLASNSADGTVLVWKLP